ncbi:MAG: hypothetical protein M3N18_01125 [Actinomycetota bacterium]|nr:hypothetical protein [Actinomycetota bacterium]
MEDLLETKATKLGTCQVGSKTEHTCHRQAVVEIQGVPFCEQCAREQEAYFAIGEMSQVLAVDRANRVLALTASSRSSRR